jgi:hypothetical protein
MADDQQTQQRVQGMPKVIVLKEDAYYSNCTLLESTPFDVAVLFGKVRPRTDEQGQSSLVEVYERQVYLSHLQARVLYDALGRTLSNLAQRQQQSAGPASTTPEPPQ